MKVLAYKKIQAKTATCPVCESLLEYIPRDTSPIAKVGEKFIRCPVCAVIFRVEKEGAE